MTHQLFLASGSPRRREILAMLGFDFTLLLPQVDETIACTDPAETVRRLARRKAEGAWQLLDDAKRGGAVVLACDTVVAIDGQILGKPKDEGDARAMLRRLSGREHKVFSGICLMTKEKTVAAAESTAVRFAALTEREIDTYLGSGEPFDKAGAYAAQGIGSLWIDGIDGCYFNVVGLPTRRLYTMLRDELGIDPLTLRR